MLSFAVDDDEETVASVECGGSSSCEADNVNAGHSPLPKRRLVSDAAVSAVHPEEGSSAAPLFKSSRKPKALRISGKSEEHGLNNKPHGTVLTHAEFLRRRLQELQEGDSQQERTSQNGAKTEPSSANGVGNNIDKPRRRRCGWDPPEADPTDIAEFLAKAAAAAPPPPVPGKGAWGPELPAEAVARQAAAIEAAVAADAKEREAQEAWERKQRRIAEGAKGNVNDDPVERLWYDRDESSCMDSGIDLEETSARQLRRQERAQQGAAGGGSLTGPSLVQQQRQRDNQLWELSRMQRGGAAIREEANLDFDEEDEHKEHVICRSITPPFLEGFNLNECGVAVVRDSSSDMAMMAKKGSALLRYTRDQEDRAAVRQRFWEIAGSTMGTLVQGRDAAEAEAAAAAAEEIKAAASVGNYRESGQFAAALKASQANKASVFSRTKTIQEQREALPVFTVRDAFVKVVREHQVIVVVGETGSGKTTQLTQYLLEEGFAKSPLAAAQAGEAYLGVSQGIIGCTQPRRVAAVSVAKRVAEERGTELGVEVGYSIRFEDCTSPATAIKYMTDGVLLRESLNDSDLEKYSCVVMDEAHERSLNTDVLFGVLKGVVGRRRDFHLIVTSATMDSERFSNFFGGCVVFHIPGRTFPVEVEFARCLPDDYVDAAVQKCLAVHCSTPCKGVDGETDPDAECGDILVFMTGQDDIEVTCLVLADRLAQLGSRAPPLTILPIHSQLPAELQAKIFEPSQYRKCIVATNIAETSLTLDGVRFVIDTGLCKLKVFNPSIGMDALQLTPISQANADQRKGRAGRTGPGVCFRLYTETNFVRELLPNTVPEIQRTNLANVVLLLKSIGVENLLEFDIMDPPPQDTLVNAMYQLWVLGALDNLGNLTALGKKMVLFPLDPPLSKMLISASEFGGAREMVSVVSLLSIPNIFYIPKEKQDEAEQIKEKFLVPESDHLTLLNVFQQWQRVQYSAQWCTRHFVQPKAMKKAKEVREQLADIMKQQSMPDSSCGTDWDILRKAICAGYFHHAAKLRGIGEYVNLRTCVSCHVHPSSALYSAGHTPEYVVYHEVLLTTKEYMRNVTAVDARWLAELGPMFFSLRRHGGHQSSRLAEEEAELKAERDFQQQIERDLERQRQKQQQREKKPERQLVEALPGRRRVGPGRSRAAGIGFSNDAAREQTSVLTKISYGEKAVKDEPDVCLLESVDASKDCAPLEDEGALDAEKLQSLRDRMRAAISKAEFGQLKADSNFHRIGAKCPGKNICVMDFETGIKTKEESDF